MNKIQALRKTAEMETEETEMCRCGRGAEQPEHSCPYQCEINNDDEFVCTCCEYCEEDCRMDI